MDANADTDMNTNADTNTDTDSSHPEHKWTSHCLCKEPPGAKRCLLSSEKCKVILSDEIQCKSIQCKVDWSV